MIGFGGEAVGLPRRRCGFRLQPGVGGGRHCASGRSLSTLPGLIARDAKQGN